MEIAEQVSDLLRSLGIDSAVIGAMALAVHGYVRSTLIALKLYAGGFKGKSDIAELLEHHRDLNLESLRQLCIRHGLGDRLEGLLDELSS